MENVQGYEIEKSILFENNRGFALGHNPAAPQPFVTWQFTENEGGVRDYYWGHYHPDREWAEKDFARRVDDYQYLFKVEEKAPGQEQGEYYRYYSTQRPFDIGLPRTQRTTRWWKSSTMRTTGAGPWPVDRYRHGARLSIKSR